MESDQRIGEAGCGEGLEDRQVWKKKDWRWEERGYQSGDDI